MFKVKPFVEVLAMTKEKLDEALAPIRAKLAKANANKASAEIEEQLVALESKIHTECAKKDLDLNAVTDLIDQYELKERRKTQIDGLVNDLFPVTQ